MLVHILVGGSRRCFSKINDLVATVRGTDQHVTSSADATMVHACEEVNTHFILVVHELTNDPYAENGAHQLLA